MGREHRRAFLLLMARVRPEAAPRLAEEVTVDDELLLMAETAADPRRRGALLDAAKDQTNPRWCLL